MNFLSHFYVHSRDSHEFNFGLLFPDFLGIVNRNYKLRQFQSDYDGLSKEFEQGIQYHLRADHYWHDCDFFLEKSELIKTVLERFSFNEKPYRPFFMTHVGLEILLDRHIVLNDYEVCNHMYDSLEAVPTDFIRGLFKDSTEAERMLQFFANFTAHRYVFSYANNEMFIYALNRLFSRVKHPNLSFSSDKNRDKFVSQLDEVINEDYKSILETIRNEA